MNGTLFEFAGLIIGAMILAAGIYYFHKEKNSAESRKIYGVSCGIGAVIIIGIILKIILAGF